MKKITLLAAFLFLTLSGIFAQKGIIAGIITDDDAKTPLNGATVRLTRANDSIYKKLVQSDSKGFFTLTSLAPGNYNLSISYVGRVPRYISRIAISDSLVNLGKIALQPQPKEEETVTVVAQVPVSQKGDTIQYSASQYKTNPDATVEDLVKKLPGVTIENGVVKAQGEEVKKVTIDGRDFFGDDATAALRNLPAEIVDKIQVFDRLSDQAQFTGFDDGNSQKAINVVTKSGMRNGQYGRVFAGYGTNDRYSVGGNMSFFKGSRRISLIGQANNINQQNFSAQDILGITSSSGGGGNSRGGGAQGAGGRGGGGSFSGGGGNFNRGGMGGGGNSFFVGQQPGISRTNSFGVNYADVWGKKLTVTGSYFFNNNNNTQEQITNQQTFVGKDSIQFYNEQSLSGSNNYNHRVNMRFEYKIDSANTLMITPNLSFQNNSSSSDITGNSYLFSPISNSFSKTERNTKGMNLSNNILFRHAFRKRGRTISFSLNTGYNNRDGETFLENNNIFYRQSGSVRDSLKQFTDQQTNGFNIGGNISFTEPFGKDGQLQIGYSPSVNKSESDQEAFKYDYTGDKYSIFDQNLSNTFNTKYTTHNGNLTFRKGNRDKMFSVGLAIQHANLNSEQVYPYTATVDRSFTNLLPEAMLSQKISKRSTIRVNYRTSTNAPSVNQLQNVINNSNPLFLSTGNPDLKQQFSQNLAIRYTFTNTGKGQSLFANVFLQQNNNYISSATFIAAQDSLLNPSVTLYRGAQLSKPVNLNGYRSLRGFVTFGQPVKAIKTNVNFNIGMSLTRIPGLVNNTSTVSNVTAYNTGVVFASNVSQYVDFTLSYNASFNNTVNSLQPELNNKYFNHAAGLQMNLLNKKGWFFQNDVSNQLYSGLSDGFNQNYWLWNMGVGKKFLKDQKGELKFSVFDLLKQNQSITRTSTESGIIDVQNKVLTQYFMLTFTYKLKNFGTPASNNNNNRENNFGPGRFPGGGF